MLVDTDVLIWNMRGHEGAAQILDGVSDLQISAVSYMELVQGLRSKAEFRLLRQALVFWQARIVDIDQRISSRACYLLEEHALGDGLQLADALIAATALETAQALLTGNVKHYRCVPALDVTPFKP